MKKMTVIILGLILMIALVGCGTQKASVDNQKPSGEVQTSTGTQPSPTTSTAEAKITITPPSGWEPVAGSVIPVQYMKNTASFMVKQEPFSGNTVDDVVKEAQKIFEKSFEDVAYVSEIETITVGGLDARKIVFTCTISNMQMKYEYVYLFVGQDVYAITFGDLATTFDSLSADYEQILKDIRFE
ncbi:MAG: hypothetical protein ACM3QW_09355 [Ignavibacteriales bacterium]